MEANLIYEVNRKYYFDNLEDAMDKARQVLYERVIETNPMYGEIFIREYIPISIHETEKAFVVTYLGDWREVGSINLLRVIIRKICVE